VRTPNRCWRFCKDALVKAGSWAALTANVLLVPRKVPRKGPNLKLIFAGTPEFAVAALESLCRSAHQVCAVYTQPDRPAGRGQRLQLSPVKEFAIAHGLPVFQPERLKSNDVALAELRSHQADVMIVVAYGLILPAAVLAIPRLGCINIHASLLPRWRGAAPIQRAIEAGDCESGVTIMQMDEGLDTGPMLARESLALSTRETGQTLHDKLAAMGARMIAEVLDKLAVGPILAVNQDSQSACYARKLDKREAWVDWLASAVNIERKVRAFTPWPIVRTQFDSQTVHILQAEARVETVAAAPGTIVCVAVSGIDVATGDGVLRITALQVPGKRAMSAAEFLQGHPLTKGAYFVSLTDRSV